MSYDDKVFPSDWIWVNPKTLIARLVYDKDFVRRKDNWHANVGYPKYDTSNSIIGTGNKRLGL